MGADPSISHVSTGSCLILSLTHARTHTAMHTQEQSRVYTVYQTGKERYIIEDLCKTVASTEQISNR